VLASYAFDGLFLDNCTVFQIANPLPSVHAEMIAALQRVLIALRQEFPTRSSLATAAKVGVAK